jgi:hypothetical protein
MLAKCRTAHCSLQHSGYWYDFSVVCSGQSNWLHALAGAWKRAALASVTPLWERAQY